MTKNEKKTEMLNAFFISVFNSKISSSLGTQPPELKDKDWKQKEAPVIQEEMVDKLLYHLGHRSLWDGKGSTSEY